MGNSSPLLQYDKLMAMGLVGGYSRSPRLSNMASVVCLSALLAVRQQWMWQLAIAPLTESAWQSVQELLDTVTGELMKNSIGEVIAMMALQTDDSLLLMDGQTVLVSEYPELATSVPTAWVVGGNITLPDLDNVGLFGANDASDIGTIVGENNTTLTVSEMPSHTHTQNPHTHTESSATITPTGAGAVVAGASLVVPLPTITGATTAINNNTGGGNSHNTIQESLKVYWYIVGK